jgi:phenylacetic acid degradation operon negative regulatory protein
MKPKTEELLYLLLWAAETAARPTFRNLTESFEGWAYRNGLHQQLAALEKAKFLESQGEKPVDRVHRLTEAGRLLALGGCDPVARWKRHWDGQWRMILFDVPQNQASARVRLRRSLAERGFGYLQNSVWITPDPLAGEREALGAADVDVESLLLLEARPCAGESDAEIVAGAWNFDAINDRYERHAAVLDAAPQQPLRDETAARRWQCWLREERLAWAEVACLDPFLPEVLHPPGYRGVKAWKRRVEVMGEAGRRMRAFKTSA